MQNTELTAKECIELQQRLLVVQSAVGKLYNALNVSTLQFNIRPIVERLEEVLGICPKKTELEAKRKCGSRKT